MLQGKRIDAENAIGDDRVAISVRRSEEIMEKHHKFSIWYVFLGVWAVLIIQSYIASMFAAQMIPYSQFLDLLKAGKIVEVAVTANQIRAR